MGESLWGEEEVAQQKRSSFWPGPLCDETALGLGPARWQGNGFISTGDFERFLAAARSSLLSPIAPALAQCLRSRTLTQQHTDHLSSAESLLFTVELNSDGISREVS